MFLKAPFVPKASKSELVLVPIDANNLRAQQRRKSAQSQIVTKTIDYALREKVVANPDSHGIRVKVQGGSVWRLLVSAPGATDLNFGFTRYQMPSGGTLHVYDPTSGYFQGPYTDQHNFKHGQLWTPLTPGAAAVIEVFIPTEQDREFELELGHVGKGFQDVFNRGLNEILKQGSCNIDVICPQGNGWRDEIRSVAVYGLNGSTFCTGTLINNVEQDFTPFFLTADHCEIDAATAPSVVAYWNYQSPNCGDLSNGTLSDNTSGAIFRADDVGNDMTLLELSSQPLANYNVHYAGWDARQALSPTGAVGIHHPNTDEKAISFNTDALTSSTSCIGPSNANSHWIVDDWEQGTTEPGSSGSGLFDPASKRLIGYLSGGSASCSNPSGLDCYGKFSTGWGLGLSTWLDPNGTGVLFVDGADPDNNTGGTPQQTRLGQTIAGLSLATTGDWLYGTTSLPNGLSALRVKIQGANSGNPDLYTRVGQLPTESLFDCRPFLGGVATEECIEIDPVSDDHFWGIRAAGAFAGVELDIAGEINLGSQITGLSEQLVGEFSIMEVEVPSDIEGLSVMITVPNGSDDPDLYLRYGVKPTFDQYDCRPFSAAGVNETCTISNPQPGKYYIGVRSFSAYSDVLLSVTSSGGVEEQLCLPIIASNGKISVVCL